jgi:transcriptional regulator with XRE-family HTH domain
MAKPADTVLDRQSRTIGGPDRAANKPIDPTSGEASLQSSGPDTAVEADRFVAGRIRQRRRELSMNQRDFAKALGVSLQQVHKYETGTNRVSAGRLYVMADTLGVSVDYFYPPSAMRGYGEDGSSESGELVHLVAALTDTAHRDTVRRLCGVLLRAERGETTSPGGRRNV